MLILDKFYDGDFKEEVEDIVYDDDLSENVKAALIVGTALMNVTVALNRIGSGITYDAGSSVPSLCESAVEKNKTFDDISSILNHIAATMEEKK